jgi:hypothetical protein
MAQNSTTTQVYVARQPIFDLNGRVCVSRDSFLLMK